MKAIYKSAEGERLVLNRYREFLKYWPVANEQLRVPTSQGETFVIASGPSDARALLLLHGGASNSAVWMAEIAAFASSFRVYCIDMIGEAGLSAPARPPLASEARAVWLDEVLNHLGITRTRMRRRLIRSSLGLRGIEEHVPPANDRRQRHAHVRQGAVRKNRHLHDASRKVPKDKGAEIEESLHWRRRIGGGAAARRLSISRRQAI